MNIKKEKIVMSITIGIACLSLMLVMFMQFKVVKETDITSIESMRESELRVELSNWKDQYKELKERYEETNQKISEYQNEKESDEKTYELLQKELEEQNLHLGKTDVEGEGIVIVLTDKGEQKTAEGDIIRAIDDEDLLIIVNELFGAGAEAISINEERIVVTSDIIKIGEGENSFIKINGKRILAPYVIRAIGNQTYLESAILGKGGHADELQELGHEISIEKLRKVEIGGYTGTISTKYID